MKRQSRGSFEGWTPEHDGACPPDLLPRSFQGRKKWASKKKYVKSILIPKLVTKLNLTKPVH